MTEPINFKEFQLVRVIDESTQFKYITFLGKYKGETAVLRLEKTPFDKKITQSAINSPALGAERSLINDVYSRYKLTPPIDGPTDLKAIVVVPADQTVLAKYSRDKTLIFFESPELYAEVVDKFITEMSTKKKDYNQWVYNILDGKSEQDNVLFNDPHPQKGFVLLPSLKSSGDDKDIHCIALCHRRDIRSLRDLNSSHLPLLKNILSKGYEVLNEKYNQHDGQLRVYIHYHPTFYHFHVHFEMIEPSEYKCSDRDHLLFTVIENISIASDYYQKVNLAFPLSESSDLWKFIGKTIIGSPMDRYLGPSRYRNREC